jgi:hypothetical protein
MSFLNTKRGDSCTSRSEADCGPLNLILSQRTIEKVRIAKHTEARGLRWKTQRKDVAHIRNT